MKRLILWFSAFQKKLDKTLLFGVTLCAMLSVFLLYIIYHNQISDVVGASYYKTQLVSTAVGLVGALLLAAIDYHKLARLWFLYAPVALALVCLTFTSLGQGRAGADDVAWLNLGFTTIQPSEFLKLAFLLTFSFHLSKDAENINKISHLALLCLHGAVPIVLIVLQGDYGTAIIFLVMFLIMLFSMGLKLRFILSGVLIAGIGGVLAWNFLLQSVHKNRILVLLHPGTDPLGLEYQQDLGLAALGSGEIFGKGISADSYVKVPEMHNDFIFSFIGQVFGYVGAMIVLVLLTFLCLKIFADSRVAKDPLGKLICLGAFAILFSHCFINIGMVLKVMPVIGIPLPFLSAGGTALLSMYLLIGLVLSTYAHSEKKYRVFYDAE